MTHCIYLFLNYIVYCIYLEHHEKLLLQVVGGYAIHNNHVGFTLKKFGDNTDIKTPVKSTVVENVRIVCIFQVYILVMHVSADLKHHSYCAVRLTFHNYKIVLDPYL